MTVNDYDGFALEYARKNETGVYNAYYERPAVLALAGEVRGARVLDAGCGAGPHAEALLAGGAEVTGMDASSSMLALARERLGDTVPLVLGDLGEALPFPDDSFELVLVPLVMHYLRDWEPTLREFHRVLVPGGRLVFSTHHPTTDYLTSGGENYFATYQFTEEWSVGEQSVTMQFWHRPLTAMTEALTGSGFAIESITEPAPILQARERFPEAFHAISTQPTFLFFAARATRNARAD